MRMLRIVSMSFTTDVSFLHIYTGRRKLVLPGLNVLYYGRLISTIQNGR